MPQIANYKDFSALNKLKNDNNVNNGFSSVPESLQQSTAKDFLFPNQTLNNFKHKNMLAYNPLAQFSVPTESVYEKFEKRSLKALLAEEAVEMGDVLVKSQEKTEEKKTVKPQAVKNAEEETTTEQKKETPANAQAQKEQTSFTSKSFVFKSANEIAKEEKKNKEQVKEEAFNFESAFQPKEDEKFKMELKKQETQAEKHNLQQIPDVKAAERQVIEFLSSQKFSKEESKKAQEKEKAQKEASDGLEKVGKDRKRVNRKKKGGSSNTMNNSVKENKTGFKNFIHNLIYSKKHNTLILLLLAFLVVVSMLIVFN